MIVKDSNITDSIGKLKKLYLIIIGNDLLKKRLYDTIVTRDTWVNIEDLLGITKIVQTNEYDLERLYLQIIFLLSFFHTLKYEVSQSLKSVGEGAINRMEPNKKILFKMTIGALDYNIGSFADLIGDLFHVVTRADKLLNGEEKALYKRFPQLKGLGKSLTE
jgi:hypothetical protein